MKKFASVVVLSVCALAAVFGFAGDVPDWQVEGILPDLHSRNLEFYSAARWIWASRSARANEQCSFRCAFNIPGPVSKVSFYAYADDSAEYWVNGTSVRRNEGADVKAAIVEGPNVFSVVASNATGRAGLLIRCDITLASGSHVVLNTDAASFKVTDGIPSGNWKSVAYDDSSWRASTELGDAWLDWFGSYDYAQNTATAEERAAKASGVSALDAQLAGEPQPVASIVYTNGMPKISLNGKLMDPVFNQSDADNDYRLNAIVKLRSLGVQINQITFRPAEYETGAGQYSFSTLDEKVGELFDVAPDAKILLLVRMEFPKWIAANPGERVEYADGDVLGNASDGDDRVDRVLRPSPASAAYRAEVRRFLGLLGAYVATKPWGKRIIAVRPSWGVYTEWHMYGMDHGPDVGPAMTAAFRQWKDGLYAGQNPPTKAERTDTSDPFFINAASHQKVIDFYDCMANEVSDCLLETAAATKEAFPGRLVGMYYGYVLATHSPEGANVMLEKVLSSPNVDFLSNPADYTEGSRLAGGAYYHRTIPETFHRYGKLVMLEDDMRHYHVYDHMNLKYICTRSEQEEEMTVRRNWMNQYFDGCGIQYLDPEKDRASRPFLLDTPPVWYAIHDSQQVMAKLGARPADSGNEVAVVVDWRGRIRRTTVERYAFELVYMHSMTGLYSTGVPFDVMTLDDYLAKPADRYRKVVFLNVVAPEGDMATALQSRVSADGMKSVWLVRCPFSLSSSKAKVYDTSNLPLGSDWWRRILVEDLGATPMAPVGHCLRRHGDVVMFHTASNGTFTVTLPSNMTSVRELYTGREYSSNVISLESDGPNTWVFAPSSSESWSVGGSVTATLSENGVLSFTGNGTTRDFDSAADMPWNVAKVEHVLIGEGVSLGANALAGLSDSVTVAFNGQSLGELRSGLGASPVAIPDGMLLVSRTEVEAAGAATLAIDNGNAILGISVCTNHNLSVSPSTWTPVKFKQSDLTLNSDGTLILAPVPVNADRGFMLLRSVPVSK